MVNVKTIEFILENDEVYFDMVHNQLCYTFTSPGYVERTMMIVTFVENERAIRSIEFLYPKIVGIPGVIQYPINITEENILNDYDRMNELKMKENLGDIYE